jgi:hypothetical protein
MILNDDKLHIPTRFTGLTTMANIIHRNLSSDRIGVGGDVCCFRSTCMLQKIDNALDPESKSVQQTVSQTK